MRTICGGLALFVIAASALAAGMPKIPPEQVMREALAAIEREGPGGVAAYLHPDELKSFKELLLRGLLAGNDYAIKAAFGADATRESIEAMPAEEFVRRALTATAQDAGS